MSFDPCETTLDFADGKYLFAMPLRAIMLLETECDAPCGRIMSGIVTGGEYRASWLRPIVEIGFEYGARKSGKPMTRVEVREFMAPYVEEWPVAQWLSMAFAIMRAALVGYDDGTPKGAPGKPQAASTPPQSTETALS